MSTIAEALELPIVEFRDRVGDTSVETEIARELDAAPGEEPFRWRSLLDPVFLRHEHG
jgi:hypothetical protein